MRLSKLTIVLSSTAMALVGPHSGARAADNSLQAVFKRMDDASLKFKGLKADVRKVAHLDVINDDTVDTGKITVKASKPRELVMLIDFTQPDVKTVRVGGGKVEIYYPKTKTVQQYDLGKHKSQVEQFFKLGFGSNSKDMLDAYTVNLGGPETVAGVPATRIELVPKSKDLQATFPKFELWIADSTGISVQQKMYQPGKDYSMATYTNLQLVPNVPDSDVNLNLPKGVTRENPLK